MLPTASSQPAVPGCASNHCRPADSEPLIHAIQSINVSLATLSSGSYRSRVRQVGSQSGEGFKDYLVFESLKSVAAQQTGEGWFVTANYKDFCGAEQQTGEGWFVTANYKDFCGADGQSHPDLQSA